MMRLERLNENKIKIFLTLDDLFDRGLTNEDLWKDSLKWHQLFHDMLEEASETFDVPIHGSVGVEIFSMQAQGMVMIVTMEEKEDEDDYEYDENFIDMQVTLEGKVEILFEINDFEYVIQLAKRLATIGFSGGSLYSYKNEYYFLVDNICPEVQTQITAIMSEYGIPSYISIYYIQEYGKIILEENAVYQIVKYFK